MSPQLAALAVHDLKNALGSLEGELLALEARPDAAAARTARLHCEQLRRDTVAFLTLYRGAALQAVVDDESPQALLQAVARAADAHAAAGSPRVALVEGAAAPPYWYLDIRLVRLALDAALHNALRHARTTVTLSAFERDGWLVLRIDDDGPGLAATAGQPHAWSTGLGTELCRAVAQAHRNAGRQGRVALHDRPAPETTGARFELILP